MSVKLRQLAEMDGGYAEMLKDFFKTEDKTDYLDMTIDQFIQFCEGKLDQYSRQVMGAMQKLEHKI